MRYARGTMWGVAEEQKQVRNKKKRQVRYRGENQKEGWNFHLIKKKGKNKKGGSRRRML